MNPLYNILGGSNQKMPALLQRFQQFQRTFKGDPRAQVQQMLNSGQISKTQYDQAVQMANQLYQTFLPGAQRR